MATATVNFAAYPHPTAKKTKSQSKSAIPRKSTKIHTGCISKHVMDVENHSSAPGELILLKLWGFEALTSERIFPSFHQNSSIMGLGALTFINWADFQIFNICHIFGQKLPKICIF